MARLLIDQNLSHRLLAAIETTFPGSVHVRDVGLSEAEDLTVWAYAAEHGLVIVSKDGDFHQMSFLYGPPPKVVWLRAGNCTTEDVLTIFRSHAGSIEHFADRSGDALLIVPGLR